MGSLANLTANNCEFPSTNAARRVEGNTAEGDLWLAFDGATAETAIWKLQAPTGITTPITLKLKVCFPTATTGSAVMDIAIMAVSGGDAINLITTLSYDTANASSAINAPASVGNPIDTTITLTNNDGIVAGDYVKIKATRKVADASDTIATDLYWIAATFEGS